MAEQFALQQSARDRCAVQGHETVVTAGTSLMNGSRNQFFSSARFTLDEDCGLHWGDQFDIIE